MIANNNNNHQSIPTTSTTNPSSTSKLKIVIYVALILALLYSVFLIFVFSRRSSIIRATVIAEWTMFPSRGENIYMNFGRAKHELTSKPLKLVQYDDVNSWKLSVENNGKASLSCEEDGFCSLQNLCYWQDAEERTNYKLFTVGENSIDWTTLMKDSGEWLRDYSGPASIVDYHRLKNHKIIRLQGSTYLFSRMHPSNLFHFTQKYLPFYDFVSNYQKYFPLHQLLYVTDFEMNEWQRGLMDVVRKLNLMKKVLALSPEKQNIPSRYSIDWNEIDFIHRTDEFPQLDDRTVVCMDRAYFPYLVSDREWPLYVTGKVIREFRDTVYMTLGIPYRSKPPAHVTILTRGSNRKFHNEVDFIANVTTIASEYGLTVSQSDLSALSFKEQVRVMSETGYFIGMHGAGMINLLFLHNHASVMEIFPYKTKNYKFKSYSYPARKMGLNYLWWTPDSIESTIFEGRWPELELRECNGYGTEDEDNQAEDLPDHCVRFYVNTGNTNVEVYPGSSAYYAIRDGMQHLYYQINDHERSPAENNNIRNRNGDELDDDNTNNDDNNLNEN